MDVIKICILIVSFYFSGIIVSAEVDCGIVWVGFSGDEQDVVKFRCEMALHVAHADMVHHHDLGLAVPGCAGSCCLLPFLSCDDAGAAHDNINL